MINTFKCPKCGHKNYVTEEDIAKRKEKLLAKRKVRLLDECGDNKGLEGLKSFLRKIWYIGR